MLLRADIQRHIHQLCFIVGHVDLFDYTLLRDNVVSQQRHIYVAYLGLALSININECGVIFNFFHDSLVIIGTAR